MAENDNYGAMPDGLTPEDPREAALVISLPAGSYTAVVSGTPGVGLVEVYDITE